jgi:hypothetical protein
MAQQRKVMKLHSVNQNLTLDEPKSSTMPKCFMQQAFPWLHLLMLLHNELVMVVILVFSVWPFSCEEF